MSDWYDHVWNKISVVVSGQIGLSTIIYHMYSDRQAWANNADPNEMLQNVASHQGLHCQYIGL